MRIAGNQLLHASGEEIIFSKPKNRFIDVVPNSRWVAPHYDVGKRKLYIVADPEMYRRAFAPSGSRLQENSQEYVAASAFLESFCLKLKAVDTYNIHM